MARTLIPSGRTVAKLAALLAVAALMAACGSGGSGTTSSSGSAGAGGELTKVKLGVPAISVVAPIYLAKEKGFFKREGIDLQLVTLTGQTALASALASGSIDLSINSPVPLLLAQDKGIPLQFVTALSGMTGQLNAVTVGKNSAITRPAQLAGKKVGISALNSGDQVALMEWVAKNGGDPKSMKLVVLPPAALPQALSSGQIDAAALTQPFLGMSLAAGNRKLGSFFDSVGKDVLSTVIAGKQDYLKKNPQVAKGFVDAMAKAAQYANGHGKEVRSVLPSYIPTLNAKAAQAQYLPPFLPTLSKASLQRWSQLGQKWNVLPKAADLSSGVCACAPLGS
jgi:NitT/TauT family transport system substrate-binding protein